MPVFLISIFTRLGLSQRLAGIAAWIAAGLAVIALCGAVALGIRQWFASHDDAVVVNHDKDVTIEAANRVINATNEADRNQIAADQTFANSQEGLKREVDTKGTDAAVGGATRAVLERLRDEQHAAANHRPAP